MFISLKIKKLILSVFKLLAEFFLYFVIEKDSIWMIIGKSIQIILVFLFDIFIIFDELFPCCKKENTHVENQVIKSLPNPKEKTDVVPSETKIDKLKKFDDLIKAEIEFLKVVETEDSNTQKNEEVIILIEDIKTKLFQKHSLINKILKLS